MLQSSVANTAHLWHVTCMKVVKMYSLACKSDTDIRELAL